MRRGVECAFRCSAEVVLDSRGARVAEYAKRSGRGSLVDLNFITVRIDVYVYVVGCWGVGVCVDVMRGRRERVVDGRRKDGGRRPQLRGGLGGMAVWSVGGLVWRWRSLLFLEDFWVDVGSKL